ncbi:MAG: hybrid signal transduction histidine kinase and diguanylate cyclase/phosphodiesterase [Gammaproteobacteria bacterium]|nr:MAG: hybrid signal transduction histidine kinase and diguanylate cyclase/phosphodiesterase [Gammaproteobacteria bacterium]TND03257.1 MAG: hybrid signal transduction histidine kinase and diguanylate cyclase/phosphodiesterase [Gammaproteobacteria bacterium]
MKFLKKIVSPRSSFQKQLLMTVSIGIVFLALASSLTTAWLASTSAHGQLVQQGTQVAQNFADQSRLALLVGAEENAVDSAHATLAFPDVYHVEIYDLGGDVLLREGAVVDWEPAIDALPRHEGQLLSHETDRLIHFIAPVFTGRSDADVSPFEATAVEPELIGFVRITMTKEALLLEQKLIFAQNVVISLSITVVLLVFLRRIVGRMTTPIQDLSQIMTRSEAGETALRAAEQGPAEVVHMAHAFNKMMTALEDRDQRLREQRDGLEREVALRTLELVQARDEAIAASRHKSEFLANMSHELRTPMNSILGYTEMVMEELEAIGQAESISDLKRVQNSANHLLSLINGILDLAKIESGRMDIFIDPVNLHELIDQVADTVRPLMKKNNNEFRIEIKQDADILAVDSAKLQQILLNLLSNAAKFTTNGTVVLDVAHARHELKVAVRDTGIGMDVAQQARVFEAFRQADMSTTRHFGGTGLGLTISQRFCAMMGGRIDLDSTPGKGTRFTVYIPLPIAENNEHMERQSFDGASPQRDLGI